MGADGGSYVGRPMLLPLLVTLCAAPVSFQTGVLTPPLIGTPGEAALRYALARKGELGLDARSTLVVGKTFDTRFGSTVQLEQTVGGVRVNGARVSITFDLQQRVVRISSSLKPFEAVKLESVITAPEAVALASREVERAWLSPEGVPYGGATKRAFLVGRELHVGYLTFIPTPIRSQNWHVAIDGTNRAVLFAQDRALRSNGAQVYASSPGGLTGGVGRTSTIGVELSGLDGGFLTGERLRALNCCPTAGCSADAGPARARGSFQTNQGTVPFDVAICDQVQRATNEPTVHPSGDYTYAPVDPPQLAAYSLQNPADGDEFAEVHAYYHVSKAYDRVRALSMHPTNAARAPFRMRDTGTPQDLPAVWVNVADADFDSAQMVNGTYVSNTFTRTSNAMYLARENMEFLLLPEQVLRSDALVIYQGQEADFAYDGPVLWHEFGHGVVHSTSDFQPFVNVDSRSANDESTALNEGMADVISAITGNDPVIGAYVGPRTDPGRSSIRAINNSERCPDVLWGESHQDSLHFTGAVWEARQKLLGTDNGETFDAAIYAALVSFPVDLTFQKAADVIASAVGLAFPARADAVTIVQEAFRGHAVTGCSKVLDYTPGATANRPYYAIPGSQFAGYGSGSSIPGPYQFRIAAPRGLKSVSLSGFIQSFGSQTRVDLLASSAPITFTATNGVLTHDASSKLTTTASMGELSGTLTVSVPCGGELYLALTNTGTRDRQLYELAFTTQAADSCPSGQGGGAGGGAAGGGGGATGGGAATGGGSGTPEQPITVQAANELLGDRSSGCGCTTASPFGVVLVALAWLRRRSLSR